MSWILRTAWRETRASRSRLVLYAAPAMIGVATLVAVVAVSGDLERGVEIESRSLAGADLVVTSRQAPTRAAELLVAQIGGERIREVAFASMLLHPASGQTRLVSVRAVEPAYPFYGRLETEPPEAAGAFRARSAVLAEAGLLHQLGIPPGDSVRLGTVDFEVAGALLRAPGESPAFALAAPRVYLAYDQVDATGLLQRGSRLNFRTHIRLPEGSDPERVAARYREEARAMNLEIQTPRSRQMSLGRAFESLDRFLGLSGFTAFLLGCIGVAGGLATFLRERRTSLTVLRCLGATRKQAAGVGLAQILGLGLIATLAGALLGLMVHRILYAVFADALPPAVTPVFPWTGLGIGLGAGLLFCLLFSLPPLIRLLDLQPLEALRISAPPARAGWPRVVALGAAMLVAALGLGRVLTGTWTMGTALAGGTAAVLACLAILGRLLAAVARRLRLDAAPFVWRQGVANLFRPNQRTGLLVPVLGLSAFLLTAFAAVQGATLAQIRSLQGDDRANLILFDIQPDQREGVEELLRRHDLPVVDAAPAVTMRLTHVAGRPVAELLADSDTSAPRWVLTREYRSTFRAELGPAERLVGGRWVPRVDPGTDIIPVSISDDLADHLDIGLGARLGFDVQGVPLETEVASLREVDWRRLQPNFFVVFPEGVLEEAPHFLIMATRTPDVAAGAAAQRELVETFPTLSAIDLTLVLDTVDRILSRVAFAFRFMAGFLVATGLVVLAGTLASGRLQRMRESVLLHTLGASRRQIAAIQTLEYALLGLISAAAGLVLGLAGGWGLTRFAFKLPGFPPVGPALVPTLVVTALAVAVGWLTGARILRQAPLDALREDRAGG